MRNHRLGARKLVLASVHRGTELFPLVLCCVVLCCVVLCCVVLCFHCSFRFRRFFGFGIIPVSASTSFSVSRSISEFAGGRRRPIQGSSFGLSCCFDFVECVVHAFVWGSLLRPVQGSFKMGARGPSAPRQMGTGTGGTRKCVGGTGSEWTPRRRNALHVVHDGSGGGGGALVRAHEQYQPRRGRPWRPPPVCESRTHRGTGGRTWAWGVCTDSRTDGAPGGVDQMQSEPEQAQAEVGVGLPAAAHMHRLHPPTAP